MATPKMIVAVDFDGTIHGYSRGWQDGSIYDNAVPGFFDWLENARRRFKVVIFSSRASTEASRADMRRWLDEQRGAWIDAGGVVQSADPLDIEITHEKPPAWITIDDRALLFRGDWSAPELSNSALFAFRAWTSPQYWPHDLISDRLIAACDLLASCVRAGMGVESILGDVRDHLTRQG